MRIIAVIISLFFADTLKIDTAKTDSAIADSTIMRMKQIQVEKRMTMTKINAKLDSLLKAIQDSPKVKRKLKK